MKILIAGDFVPQERVLKRIYEKDYYSVFEELKPYIETCDYSILNLEAPIVSKSTMAEPIHKVGPSLSVPVETAYVIRDAGFNCVTLANNHILDFGGNVLLDTLRILDENCLFHVGAGRNLDEASKVLFLKNGIQTISIVNFCEREFSVAEKDSPGAFPMDMVKNYRQVQYAKQNSDFVIVIVHGGHELYRLPSPRMKEYYRFLVDAGSDAVVNHHQHCSSGYEVYSGKPIFYGLGNLCFDTSARRYSSWNYGYFVILSIGADISFEVVPYSQCLEKPVVRILNGEELSSFTKEIKDLNSIIEDDEELESSFGDYVKSKQSEMFFRLSRYNGKVLRSMFHHHLLPRRPGKNRALKMLNLLECESQRDLVTRTLSIYVNEDDKK